MPDNTFNSRLRRLFSTNVVVRRLGKDRLKVVDSNRLQSAGNPHNSKHSDRFAGVRQNGSRYSAYNGTGQGFQFNKADLYSEYEAMDLDPIIASALDVYADECTVKNVEHDVLGIKTNNAKIQKILHNLFYDILNIEYNLWPWVRNACKYGDFYLHLAIEPDLGIINATPLSSYEVIREEGYDPENPFAYRFILQTVNAISVSNKNHIEPYEIAHFRLLSDANFLPYGKSMIEPARKVFKQLILMEDAMLLHRIMRAPQRRLFYIDVGNIPPNEVDSHMQNIMNKMKKTPYIDEQTGEYNLKFNLTNMLEDFYLPVRGGESGTKIESMDGLSNDGQIDDIEYLRNKMMAALKIPKAFLGYDEGVEGKATLAAEDIRFARTIERVQRIFISELTKIAIIHLYSQGFENEELIDFELKLTSPSIIYEKQKVELMNERQGLASNLLELNMFSEQWIYENIFDMSEEQWTNERVQVIEDLKERFRREQITSEGNDPKVTNKSFGTAHDIASMHVASGVNLPGLPEKNEAGPGRPKEYGTWGKHKDAFGRDPFGTKDKAAPDLSIEQKNITSFIDALPPTLKTARILSDSLASNKPNLDEGTLLDELNLIND
jgi:hypothetical protein